MRKRLPPPPQTALEIEARSRTLKFNAEAEKVVAEVLASPVGAASTKDLPSPERIATFVRVVGAAEVRTALAVTVQRMQRHARGEAHPVAFPWDYLAAVVNGRPARLRYLYLLLYLWETSLRTRIDAVMTAAKGPTWYLNPANYVRKDHVARLYERNPEIGSWSRAGQTVDPTIPTGMAFLEKVYLSALHMMLLDSWTVHGPMLRLDGRALDWSSANELFGDIENARRITMHVLPVDNATFRASTDRLRTALRLVDVNVERALSRISARDPYKEDLALFEGAFAVETPRAEPLAPS